MQCLLDMLAQALTYLRALRLYVAVDMAALLPIPNGGGGNAQLSRHFPATNSRIQRRKRFRFLRVCV